MSEIILDGNLTINDFMAKLGAKEPVPGGGGAAALTASIGINLCRMAAVYTVGKKKFADVEDKMQEILIQTEKLSKDFIDFIQRDAEGFYPLSQAYGLPSDTDEEKKLKEEVLERELTNATVVPLELMEKICEAIGLASFVAEKGSRLMVSDSACALSTLKSALNCASLNVFINTKLMKNREKAEEINSKANEMLSEYCSKADSLYSEIKSSMMS